MERYCHTVDPENIKNKLDDLKHQGAPRNHRLAGAHRLVQSRKGSWTGCSYSKLSGSTINTTQ